ncbi:hypothetical protein GCM10010431_54480 [Streptomyces kunmingensis]
MDAIQVGVIGATGRMVAVELTHPVEMRHPDKVDALSGAAARAARTSADRACLPVQTGSVQLHEGLRSHGQPGDRTDAPYRRQEAGCEAGTVRKPAAATERGSDVPAATHVKAQPVTHACPGGSETGAPLLWWTTAPARSRRRACAHCRAALEPGR